MRKNSLGGFISKKRSAVKLSSRQLAMKCDISATYMNDIERDKRIPTFEVLKKISYNLNFNDEDTYVLLDLAAKSSNNRVPYDIIDYIMNNDSLRKCIREKIKNNDYSGWEKALESNNKEVF